MNTYDAIQKLKAGETIPKDTPIKVRGYLPCHLATGKPGKDGRNLVVVFEGGKRMRFPFDMILFGQEDVARGYVLATVPHA